MRPRLYLIVGAPGQGKTTLSRWFDKIVRCCILHTDGLFIRWTKQNQEKHYYDARVSIKRCYPRLTAEAKLAWDEDVVKMILAKLEENSIVVVEGWLLLHLTYESLAKLHDAANIVLVKMHRYTATANEQSFRPINKNYKGVVESLIELSKEEGQE